MSKLKVETDSDDVDDDVEGYMQSYDEAVGGSVSDLKHIADMIGDITNPLFDTEFSTDAGKERLKEPQEDNNEKEVFFRVDRISFNVLWAPFFQEKALIIPSLRIKKPYVHLIKETPKSWNISALLEPGENASTYKPYTIKKMA